MDYTTDRFLEKLYQVARQKTEAESPRSEKQAQLKHVTGLDRLDALHFTPEWQTESVTTADGYRLTHYAVQTLPALYTPVYELTPDNYQKTVIYCHGHGKGNEEVTDEAYRQEYQHCLPITLARAGYRVLVPELVGFNRVVQQGFRETEHSGCYANSTQFLMFGITMTAVRVNQILQAIDHVYSDGAVRPVLCGISGGGLVAAYTAALDSRPAGAFISGYVNTFKSTLLSLYHCVDNFVPDILSVGEEPEIIALACPMPLLISAGEQDPIFPLEATREAIETIRRIYARQQAESKISVEIFPSGHEISTAALMPWLQSLA